MRIALVDTTKAPKFYPLGLMKIAAWKKSEGHEVKLFIDKLPKTGDYDEIWLSTLFTFDVPKAKGMVKEATHRAKTVWVGGVSASLMPKQFEINGARVHVGLLDEAEKFAPDYTILEHPPEYSIMHTSRGCVRNCGFCMVPKIEKKFQKRENWIESWNGTKKIFFFDNNWLAKDMGDIEKDLHGLRGLVKSGKVNHIDFNQGLDARILKEEHARMMSGLPIKPIRFAFDGMQEDGYYQRAVKMMADYGFKTFMSYVLYNFSDTPQDFYYRLRESVSLSENLGVMAGSFPMRYQPILEADTGRNYVGKHWTEQKKKSFMNILNKQSISGQITFSKLADFEYWFTESAEKFDRLLSYPKLNEYMAKKKGALRK